MRMIFLLPLVSAVILCNAHQCLCHAMQTLNRSIEKKRLLVPRLYLEPPSTFDKRKSVFRHSNPGRRSAVSDLEL